MRRDWPASWHKACQDQRGRLLTGSHAHYCRANSGLVVDETTPEWPCACFEQRPTESRDVLANLTDDGDEVV